MKHITEIIHKINHPAGYEDAEEDVEHLKNSGDSISIRLAKLMGEYIRLNNEFRTPGMKKNMDLTKRKSELKEFFAELSYELLHTKCLDPYLLVDRAMKKLNSRT